MLCAGFKIIVQRYNVIVRLYLRRATNTVMVRCAENVAPAQGPSWAVVALSAAAGAAAVLVASALA